MHRSILARMVAAGGRYSPGDSGDMLSCGICSLVLVVPVGSPAGASKDPVYQCTCWGFSWFLSQWTASLCLQPSQRFYEQLNILLTKYSDV